MVSNAFQALIALIILIIGESIIFQMVKSVELPGYLKFLFIIAFPAAVIYGIYTLFRR